MNRNFSPVSADTIWEEVLQSAARAALDPAVFNTTHRTIVDQIVRFLNTPPAPDDAVPPIIICGIPGTGKTTFLYLLDTILRQQFQLPDTIEAEMHKPNGRAQTVHKRQFDGRAISLLSVSKWADLLHFYTWDTEQHRFDTAAQAAFVQNTLAPMRVIFADEVEMVGYSPTIPTLAKNGILVVGTSNQTQFKQLERHDIPAQVYPFGGDDMRAGDPADAVVVAADPLWQLFASAAVQPSLRHEQLPYQVWRQGENCYLLLPFRPTITAAMLDNEWIAFLQAVQASSTSVTLLIDDFSLEGLRTNYNGIIRFIALFDAIEQLGIGVLVRGSAESPALSREAIDHMKVTIETTRGLPDAIKRRTVVGIGRFTSRLGQAGHRARQLATKTA